MSKLSTIDLFAGCGGLMDGFQQSGLFETLACVEWEKAPCQNLINRLEERWGHKNASREVLCFDIQRTDELFKGYKDPIFGISEGLDKIIGKDKVDVIIGGPPCQAYSLAGRIRDEHGMRDDYRNYLFESYLKVVKHYQPDFFIFENVVGLLSAAPNGTLISSIIKNEFEKSGYAVISDLKNAVFSMPDYGIPQNRKRIIILGVRKKSFPKTYNSIIDDFYNGIMPSYKQSQKTVQDAIGDLPKFKPIIKNNKVIYQLCGNCSVANHVPRGHSVRDINVFKLLTEDIEHKTFKYTSVDSLKELYTQVTGRKSNIHKYYVLRREQQSNTIPAHLYKDGFRHIHPDSTQCRTLTVREAARLQTFDDDYEFVGSMGEQYKMIGNAVPPAFAKILACALGEIYSSYCPDKIPNSLNENIIQVYPQKTRAVQLMLGFEKRKKKSKTNSPNKKSIKTNYKPPKS